MTGAYHRHRKTKNRLLKFCYVPATSTGRNSLLFFLFLLRPFTVLMKQTRQAVRAIKQSIFLDVYGAYVHFIYLLLKYFCCYFFPKIGLFTMLVTLPLSKIIYTFVLKKTFFFEKLRKPKKLLRHSKIFHRDSSA